MLCLDNYYMETVKDIFKNQTVLKPVNSPNISLKISLPLKTGPILLLTAPSSSGVVQNAMGICTKVNFSEKIIFPELHCYMYR